jgi:hypothetical protein
MHQQHSHPGNHLQSIFSLRHLRVCARVRTKERVFILHLDAHNVSTPTLHTTTWHISHGMSSVGSPLLMSVCVAQSVSVVAVCAQLHRPMSRFAQRAFCHSCQPLRPRMINMTRGGWAHAGAGPSDPPHSATCVVLRACVAYACAFFACVLACVYGTGTRLRKCA